MEDEHKDVDETGKDSPALNLTLPRVAVVGRPNVGKSTLFNRIAGKTLALVDDTPGVTRDQREVKAELGGHEIVLVDTAGFEDAGGECLEARMRAQTEAAVMSADLVLFVYDARVGVTGLDEIFADFIRRSGKPVILVANKCESQASLPGVGEGYSLGMGEPVEVAAEHNIGMIDLDEAVASRLRDFQPELEEGLDTSEAPVRIAIVGRPNAGKSTLINTLIGKDRLLTGPEAGVTRDSITVDWDWHGRRVQFHDTAGLRKKAKVQDRLEKMSTADSIRAIKFAQVVVLLMDVRKPLDKQDMQIADLCAREGRALVLAFNMWDLVKDKSETARALRERTARLLPQLKGLPVVFLSALTGKGVERLFPAIEKVQIDWSAKIRTSDLNDWLAEVTNRNPPPADKGRPVKLKYISQIKTRPPTFVVKSSRADAVPESYRRFLVNALREDFDLPGIPIRLSVRAGANPYVKSR